jgi:hypothetical protein
MIWKALSQVMTSNSDLPRSAPFFRKRGWVMRAGEYCFMIPDDPLAQSTPSFSGWFGLPSM